MSKPRLSSTTAMEVFEGKGGGVIVGEDIKDDATDVWAETTAGTKPSRIAAIADFIWVFIN